MVQALVKIFLFFMSVFYVLYSTIKTWLFVTHSLEILAPCKRQLLLQDQVKASTDNFYIFLTMHNIRNIVQALMGVKS